MKQYAALLHEQQDVEMMYMSTKSRLDGLEQEKSRMDGLEQETCEKIANQAKTYLDGEMDSKLGAYDAKMSPRVQSVIAKICRVLLMNALVTDLICSINVSISALMDW